jgi:superfamily I DNA/RNA helicase
MDDSYYKGFQEKRSIHTDTILNSDHSRKIVIAGPGTGKSHLFRLVCEDNIKNDRKNNITLTFINELVNDLSKDLDGLSDVKTLHSFALSRLSGDRKVFLNLGKIITDDYRSIHGYEIDFDELLGTLSDEKEKIEFYLKRRQYYNFFSPNCSVYCLIQLFENNESKIPIFSQVLVDEFQDFNPLEAKLINTLASKSPVVIAGDDDQAIYNSKFVDIDEIRSIHKSEEYESFTLPYCSRCPEVIINTYHDIVSKAQSLELLKNRIDDKKYEYFSDIKKDEVSKNNPKIQIKKRAYKNNVAFHFKYIVEKLFNPKDSIENKTVLIICPYSKHIPDLEARLRKKGFTNIETRIKNEKDRIHDGFRLLLEDSKCNLGWRIVGQHVFESAERDEEFKKIVTKSNESNTEFLELLKTEDRKYIKSILAKIRKILNNDFVEEEDKEKVYECLGYDFFELAQEKLQESIESDIKEKNLLNRLPIKITTIAGSKGLSADYVFMVNFDDKYLLTRQEGGSLTVTDNNIFNFLVALTRTKIRAYILTGENKLPTFVKWMDNERYEEI